MATFGNIKTNKQVVLILSGLPSSGKSTYAKELMEKEPNKWKRINKDLLREMCDCGVWSRENEDNILKVRNSLIEDFLFMSFNVIVDDTNFSPKHINSICEIAQDNGVEVKIKFIDTPVYECIERDKLRGDKSVGKKVILDMWKKYLQKPPKQEYNPELPNCIIVDVDGTLAYKCDRDIFDYSKVKDDIPNKNLMRILAMLDEDLSVFILSGRDDDSREQTEAWLYKNGVAYNDIFMRITGDKRADHIIKGELYEEHIKGKYNVIGVFDDRPQVINGLWKKEGLFVLDCNRHDSRIDF